MWNPWEELTTHTFIISRQDLKLLSCSAIYLHSFCYPVVYLILYLARCFACFASLDVRHMKSFLNILSEFYFPIELQ